MAKTSDIYAYVDLGELSSRLSREEDEDSSSGDGETSCRGKVLLLLTTGGMEIVQIPHILH